MTKQESEKAIKNGESVWGCLLECLLEICNDNTVKIDENIVGSTEINEYGFNFIDLFNNSFYLSFKDVYKTKAEAEHYLHHANITRIEHLPFLTWEEFDKGDRLIRFIGKNGEKCKLEGYQSDDTQGGFIDVVVNGTGSHIDYDYTEENFYKAYDECVRLFKGEE